MRENRKINPLDINNNITIGVSFPLNEVNLFKGTQTVKEQIKTNLINLLLTEPGERLYLPDFGCGLKQLLFDNNPNPREIRELIRHQLSLHVPEINIIDLESNVEEHTLKITLSYSIPSIRETDAVEINVSSPLGTGNTNLSNSATSF